MILALSYSMRLGAGLLRAMHQHGPRVRQIHWPASPNPSPYQIFGLEPRPQVIDKKKLRKIYFDLVKLYHPDRGTTGDATKFKKVVEAHNILKDDAQRRSYDMTQTMSSTATGAPMYSKQRENAFEDDIDYNYWSNKNQKEFDKGLNDNRMWVLKLVATVTITFAFINMMLLREASEARNEALAAETERAAAQLARSFGNYGKGDDAQKRIQRFLEHRQMMLDRFDNEFSWEKFKAGGSSSDQYALGNTEKIVEENALLHEPSFENAPPTPPRSSVKRHSGPVAEYFGRN